MNKIIIHFPWLVLIAVGVALTVAISWTLMWVVMAVAPDAWTH
jgi:hypothetical protein